MGYTDGMARDILEDLKRDYYDEIDTLQDTLSYLYDWGFRLQLLLRGIHPDDAGYTLTFAERRTETLSQTTDRALKLKALGAPEQLVWSDLGQDPARIQAMREEEGLPANPYPDDPAIPDTGPRVSITPGNGRKGESGTAVNHG